MSQQEYISFQINAAMGELNVRRVEYVHSKLVSFRRLRDEEKVVVACLGEHSLSHLVKFRIRTVVDTKSAR